MVRPHIQGFTLIEMMIVILIVGLLALIAGPFTGAWSDGANVHKAQGELDQAVRYARAAALRNEVGARGNEAAIRLLVDGSEVKVCRTVTGACADVWWQTEMPSGVSIAFPSGVPSKILFDNKGLALDAVTITLSRGGETHAYPVL